ncbi:DUF3365 domain-containing protein [Hydrogenophaga sp. 70-12]|uniref:Tll0287-like domain-containing protein n=1 Tax=Hydrogenophaga sp. 70-12 TaxID=1895769 RepID=UPI000ADE1307|nr:DUF3365 domain-containing protein [Hydrogenophaga sp. 70-12]
MMKKALLLTLLLSACATPQTEAQKPDDHEVDALRATAKTLTTQLGGRLKQEMKANGPESAVRVCKQVAPQIAADLSRQTGRKVGRVGTRVRNTETGVPDEWDAKALAVFTERLKQGEKPDTMELVEVVTVSSGKQVLRYAKAITLQPMCVTCHGSPEHIPDGVKARLQADYPHDKATGYGEGELRGAVVISRPL